MGPSTGPSIFDYLGDPEERRKLLLQSLDATSRGVIAGGLGGAADMGNVLLNLGKAAYGYAGHKAGLLSADQMPQLNDKPMLGSEWIGDKMQGAGLLGSARNPMAEGIAGGLLAPAAATRGPQVVNALLAAERNMAAPVAMGQKAGQRGAVDVGIKSRVQAMETAQRNAAKPVSEGGLGLGPNNTAAERAEAMGFNTPAYHGTPDDGIVRTRQFKDEMLGKSTRVSDAAKGHYTSDRGQVASEFIWKDGDTAGGNVLPLLLAGRREKVHMPGEWMPGKYDRALDAARAAGFDGLDISGVTTLGKPGNYQVSFDPKNMRSRFAAFDPASRHTADILGGADPALLALLGLSAGGVAYANKK